MGGGDTALAFSVRSASVGGGGAIAVSLCGAVTAASGGGGGGGGDSAVAAEEDEGATLAKRFLSWFLVGWAADLPLLARVADFVFFLPAGREGGGIREGPVVFARRCITWFFDDVIILGQVRFE